MSNAQNTGTARSGPLSASEKMLRAARLEERVRRYAVRRYGAVPFVPFAQNEDSYHHRQARYRLANRVHARRIIAAAREAGCRPGGNPGPGHTCEGTVQGAIACPKCLGRKADTIALNAWAKLQDAKRAATVAAPKPKRAKKPACPNCGYVA